MTAARKRRGPVLGSLLGQIDRIYDLELEVNIEDYLISGETCRRLSGEAQSGAVLVTQTEHEGEVQLGVYVREEALSQLEKLDLASRCTSEDLAALCTAIEEVSHFAYLLWNATREKSVTQLELELQGEVDKFITSSLLIARHNDGLVPAGLFDRIFHGFRVRDDLDEARRERYEVASSLARAYCSSLFGRFLRPSRLGELLFDLRHFYRLTQAGKIGHIYRAAYTS